NDFLGWVIVAPGQVLTEYIRGSSTPLIIGAQPGDTGHNLPIPNDTLIILVCLPPEIGQVGKQSVRAITKLIDELFIGRSRRSPPVRVVVAEMNVQVRIRQVRRGGIEKRARRKNFNPSL